MRSRLQYENWDKRNDRDDGNSSTEGEMDVDTTDTSDDEVYVDVDEVDENNAAEAVAAEIRNENVQEQPSNQEALNAMSRYYRYCSLLQGSLTAHSSDNLQLLLNFISTRSAKFPGSLKQELLKVKSVIGHLSQWQIRYRVQKIHENLCRASQTDMDMLLKYWLGVLLEDPCIESLLSNASVELDEQYLPKSVLVSRTAAKIAKQLVTSRKNVTDGFCH